MQTFHKQLSLRKFALEDYCRALAHPGRDLPATLRKGRAEAVGRCPVGGGKDHLGLPVHAHDNIQDPHPLVTRLELTLHLSRLVLGRFVLELLAIIRGILLLVSAAELSGLVPRVRTHPHALKKR